MSQETSTWLNQRTLIGYTEHRGEAWHYRAEEQGDETNHYTGAIPVVDVQRRLFNWQAEVGTITTTASSGTYTDPNRQAVLRPKGALDVNDTGAILGIFKKGYTVHQFNDWLVETTSNILDSELNIGSAGLLRGGAIAWVSLEVPDSVTTPEGVEFRPNLIATTSHDGSLSTTFKRVVTIVVCDNTRSAALAEKGQQVKVKHSSKSLGRINDVREALNIVYTTADDFAAEVAELCATEVSGKQWQDFLNAYAPMPEENGQARTMVGKKHDELNQLWTKDPRCAQWRGNAFGVVQTVNTWQHHVAPINKGTDRAGKNMFRAIDPGVKGIDALDSNTLTTLRAVLV
jgi:phage/plasmid-like protein (TIGR03299 family)